MTDARRWSIQHYREFGVPEDEARNAAAVILRDMIRREGFSMDDDTLTPGTPVPIRMIPGGYKPHAGGGDPDGWITEWSVAARLPITDDVTAERLAPADGDPDGKVARFAVPLAMTAEGGEMRLPHNLGGEVTVTAFRSDGTVIGYHFTQPITDDMEHVVLAPGASYLVVTRDEDAPV